MSQTGANELLTAIQNFLREDVLPQLDGFSAYNTRIAANSLAIVGRELELGGDLVKLDNAIAENLGIDQGKGPVTQQIARMLRDGDLELDTRLLDYFKQRALKSLEIDNPRYSGFLQARRRWSPEQTPA